MEAALGISAAVPLSVENVKAQVLICKAELAAMLGSICKLPAGI